MDKKHGGWEIVWPDLSFLYSLNFVLLSTTNEFIFVFSLFTTFLIYRLTLIRRPDHARVSPGQTSSKEKLN